MGPAVYVCVCRSNIDCVAFPDDGAEKRFGYLFKKAFPDMEMVTCGKKRDSGDPSKRLVVVSCHDIAAIWVEFFSRSQRYRCWQVKGTATALSGINDCLKKQ